MNAQPAVIPLPRSLQKRLYEPTILLSCVTTLCAAQNNAENVETETERETGNNLRQIYFHFLDKLGQVCDTDRGGRTSTSFAALCPGTGGVEYYFASNDRDAEALGHVKSYIEDILKTVGGIPRDVVEKVTPESPISAGILHKILQFNRPRIESYAKVLARELDSCIEATVSEGTVEAQRTLMNLQIWAVALDSKTPSVDDNELTRRSQALLCAVGQQDRDSLGDFLSSKVREDLNLHGPGARRWMKVRHATCRLLSYLFAAEAFLWARRLWPELFVNFEVIPVASSTNTAPDGRNALRLQTSASGIIMRMTHSDSIIDACLRGVSKMERAGLDFDGQVRRAVRRFAPMVHAEVLVNDAIRRSGSRWADNDPPPLFFRETEFGRYIGSSEPACRLCALYFAAHSDDVRVRVRVRSAHRSRICYNWRAPDVFESDGPGVEKRRRAAVEQMVMEIRRDAIMAIRKQFFNHSPGTSMVAVHGSSDELTTASHHSHAARLYPTNSLRESASTRHLGDGISSLLNRLSS